MSTWDDKDRPLVRAPHTVNDAERRRSGGDPQGQRERRLRDLEWQQQQREGLVAPGLAMQDFTVGGDGAALLHSWRVWFQIDGTDLQYKIDDGGGTRAGTVLAVDGTPVDVDPVAWTTFTAAVSLYLKVIVTGAGTLTCTIETGTRPTPDFTAANPVFVFDLADVDTDGTILQYLTEDVGSLQGLPRAGGSTYQVWQKKATGWGFDDVRMTT